MRASSRLIDTNSKILRAALKGLKAHESKAALKFSIYDKEGILLGWKNAENENDDITKQNIENWIKELQSDSSKSPNQVKIGYAHNTTSGDLYDIM
jgi:hypothetical protein